MKTKLMALAAVIAVSLISLAEPTVTDITAKQRYPWNGLVDITCKVSGIEADAGGYEFVVVAVDKDTSKEYTVSNFSIQYNGEEVPDVCDNGDYSLLWNSREDMGQVVIDRMTVRITLEALAVSVGKVQLWEGGPYWADRNIGADKPWDYGLYFWWGDTTGHRPSGGTFSFSFVKSNCPTDEKSINQLQSEGWITSNGVLSRRHDAAHVKWGGSWRMPTDQELSDLCSKCDWTWMTINGVNGYVVRGRGDYDNNNIFLPAAGCGNSATSLFYVGWDGYYWSSVPADYIYRAYRLLFYSDEGYLYHGVARDSRRHGKSIRPVQ